MSQALIVERMRPDGYVLLNGHHRWEAALRMGVRRVPIRIVNLTQAADIQQDLKNAKHQKRVALDLDEVVFLSDRAEEAEKEPSFPLNRLFSERLRPGVPALLHHLKTIGYDIWGYTAKYYSMEYIRRLFKCYRVQVDGVVTGAGRRGLANADEKKKLEQGEH